MDGLAVLVDRLDWPSMFHVDYHDKSIGSYHIYQTPPTHSLEFIKKRAGQVHALLLLAICEIMGHHFVKRFEPEVSG